jgi:hypothetical protein
VELDTATVEMHRGSYICMHAFACIHVHFIDNTPTMTEITTSYNVTFRMTVSPPELDVNLNLIRHAEVFAESLVATAVESLPEYEYIAGPIQIQGIESSLARKFENCGYLLHRGVPASD